MSGNHARKLTAPVPTHGKNRYQWTKRDHAPDGSPRTSNGTGTSKSSNLERNYDLGNTSQDGQAVDTQQREYMHRNRQKSVYKISGVQLTGEATQNVNVAQHLTEATSNSSDCRVQPRSARTAKTLQSAQTSFKVGSCGFIDKKATAFTMSHSVSSADTAVARTSHTERPDTQLVAMNALSKEDAVAREVAGNDIKNIAAVSKHTVADGLRMNVEQSSTASSAVNQNCLVNKTESIDSVIKSSNGINRLCAINKYKLIRPVDDKNVQQVVPLGSQFACKQALAHKKKSPKSAALATFCEKGRDVIHKSKYKFVKSLQDSFNSNSSSIVFPGVQVAPFQLSQVYGSCGANEEQQRWRSHSGDTRVSSATISSSPVVANISKNPSANKMHVLSRYKLVKTNNGKHQQTSKENRKRRSRTQSFTQGTKKKGWISKYALKREFGGM